MQMAYAYLYCYVSLVFYMYNGLQQIFNSLRYSLEFWYSDSRIGISYSFTYVLCSAQLSNVRPGEPVGLSYLGYIGL